MRSHVVLKYIGMVLLLNAVLMYVSVALSLFNDFDAGFYPLMTSAFIATVVGVFPFVFIKGEFNITNKESYAIVISAMSTSCVIGAMPFLLFGGEFTFVNSLFESVSGYTTTGATILSNVEALPKSMLFWRSSTHLIGGAGIIIFALALLPMISKSRASLSNVELSAFVKDNFKYKVQKSVQIVLYVYFLLIALETILLHIAGMTWFDAINHSFSTLASGGFSTKNTSILYFNNAWIEGIIVAFMVLAGLHFGLIYSSLTTRKNNIFRSEVARFYLLTMAVAIVLCSLNLWLTNSYGIVDSLRYSSFQVASIMSTTGFANADTSMWPPLAIIVIIFISFNGGCAGSTAGGIQSDRVLLIFKSFKAHFLQLQHPNAIIKIRLSKINTDDNLLKSTLIFALFFILVVLFGTIISTALGVDVMTSFSSCLTCISNIGPGFNLVSSFSNYDVLPDAVKVLYMLIMLAGRLQLFSFFQLFLLSSWR
ncbi:MAG: TrkH family potassium uptake protein [Bacteroidetes bacterium]|nr:TrkH family potassium uptake protein [Bacteroidota bacterium]